MSTGQAAVRQISCTQCGAPLELHGGSHIKSLSCGYCGAVLDSKDEYKVLLQHKNRQRPYSPLQLGMKGVFKEVEFTLIGMVQYTSGDGYNWLDYQLFSPTHGYVWLTFNEGHFAFTRRMRDVPTPSRPSDKLRQRSLIRLRDQSFKVFERYQAKITYVEGELTWIAREGDENQVLEAIDPPYIFAYVQSANELEYEITEYMQPEAIYAAFNIDGEPDEPDGIHPAQPYPKAEECQSLSKSLRGYLFFNFALILLAWFSWGATVVYLVISLVLLFGLLAYINFLPVAFEQRRWGGSDADDDDED